MSPSALIEKLNWRYAVKKFDPSKKISSQDWQALEDALVLTPSSYGLQPWKFLVITNSEVRKKLTPLSWNQQQVEGSSHYVVMCAKNKVSEADVKNYIQRIAEVRGVPLESLKSYYDMMVGDVVKGPRSQWAKEWAARQVYIALGNLMTVAAILNIDSCPMEGFDPQKYDEVLGLKGSGYHSVVCLALGYRANDDKLAQAKKVRAKNADVVQHI
jgi:nitroreductase